MHKLLLSISALVSAYNVNQLPASIINKPGVFQPELTSYFGFSLSPRVVNGETNILIGAPAYKQFGAVYNCDEYGKCDDYYPDSSYQNNSMFGASVTWIDNERLLSCEPRYTQFYKCMQTTNCRFKDYMKCTSCVLHESNPDDLSLSSGEAAIPGRCHLIPLSSMSSRRRQHLTGCSADPSVPVNYMTLTSKCNNHHGTSITRVDDGHILMTRPGFQYAEGGWSVADLASGAIFQNSTPLDWYYQQHADQLPPHVRTRCITPHGGQSNQCINAYMQENYDHTHLGMSSVKYRHGILLGAPHKYRSSLTGAVSFYPITYGKVATQSEEWNITAGDQVGIAGEQFGWSIDAGQCNADSFDDVAIGAPGFSTSTMFNKGRVFVLIGGADPADFERRIILPNPSITSRNFGYTVKWLDVDSDGRSDLLVAAPFGPDGGEVFLYNGNDASGIYNQPSQRIKRDNGVNWFGFAMAMSNNLLIIGSPYRDAVETFRLKPAIEVKLTTKWLPTAPVQFE